MGHAAHGLPAKTRTTLLVEKRWRYLRYLHLRSAIGVGKGLAELALAVEFPHIQFRLTDIESATTPWSFAQRAVPEWKLPNVRFDILDITQPPRFEADLVASTEVLEHIEDADQAARHMLAAASRYVFALAPFAEARFNDNANRCRRVFESHGHFVCGYDEAALARLFPDPVEVRGCYWAGRAFRSGPRRDGPAGEPRQRRAPGRPRRRRHHARPRAGLAGGRRGDLDACAVVGVGGDRAAGFQTSVFQASI